MRPRIAFASLILVPCHTVLAQTAPVTISGGADETGKNYFWTVTNRSPVALVAIEFPHYGADLFMVPEGWKAESTNLIGVGVSASAGVCRAAAPNAQLGLAMNRSAEFSMRAPGGGSVRGPGRVTVFFADGTNFVVEGVELPVAVPAGDKYVSLIGLGVIFGGLLLFRWFRGRRAHAGPPAGAVPE